MTGRMDTRVLRLGLVVAGLALLGLLGRGTVHNPAARAHGPVKLTPEIKARGLSFAPDVSPTDRAWVVGAIAKARPEAQQLIGAVDGLVTVHTVNVPNAPYAGFADERTDDVTLNIAYLDGERRQDRDQSVLHELGHIIDFILVPDDEIARLAAQIPTGSGCLTAETGDCTAPEERFADTFAKWALRGAVSGVGAGYGISTPAGLEEWGEPLALLAAQVSVSA
jgi:hypothetical protein